MYSCVHFPLRQGFGRQAGFSFIWPRPENKIQGFERSLKMISILLIDDQLIVAKALQEMLKQERDLKLHYCKDIATLEADLKAAEPCLILQDLMMPGVDGLKLVEKLKQDPVYSSVPLIVFIGSSWIEAV